MGKQKKISVVAIKMMKENRRKESTLRVPGRNNDYVKLGAAGGAERETSDFWFSLSCHLQITEAA